MRCSIDNCARAHLAKGLCRRHYNRQWATGATSAKQPWNRRRDRPEEERFWEKVDKSGECWIWLAAKLPKGYGLFKLGGRYVYAHRYSWQLANGALAGERDVCHQCDNPNCVRPSHLFVGSRSDNMQDSVRKGRGRWQHGLS